MGQQPYAPGPEDVYQPGEQPGRPTGNTYPNQRGGGPRPTGLPFPGISGTTKGGTRYYVSGCCLPLPLGCLTVLTMAGSAALAARLRGR